MGPQVKALADRADNLELRRINIKNWDSDVATQYGINSIPYFILYNESGELDSEGGEAVTRLSKW